MEKQFDGHVKDLSDESEFEVEKKEWSEILSKSQNTRTHAALIALLRDKSSEPSTVSQDIQLELAKLGSVGLVETDIIPCVLDAAQKRASE